LSSKYLKLIDSFLGGGAQYTYT